MITGIARIFQQGAKARERSDRVGEWWVISCTLNFLFSLYNHGGGGAGPLYPLIATPVAVV